jgi:hypothetical protein
VQHNVIYGMKVKAIAGLKKSQLVFIEKKVINAANTQEGPLDIIFYTDNCCGEQKNKHLVAIQ